MSSILLSIIDCILSRHTSIFSSRTEVSLHLIFKSFPSYQVTMRDRCIAQAALDNDLIVEWDSWPPTPPRLMKGNNTLTSSKNGEHISLMASLQDHGSSYSARQRPATMSQWSSTRQSFAQITRASSPRPMLALELPRNK